MNFSSTPDSQASGFVSTSASGSGSGSGPPAPGVPGTPGTPGAPGDAPSNAAGKPARVLACQLCQTRKIKCDRQSPCGNCKKVHQPCHPSIPAPARQRRRPNQDLQERLARCEDMLRAFADGSGNFNIPPGYKLVKIDDEADDQPDDQLDDRPDSQPDDQPDSQPDDQSNAQSPNPSHAGAPEGLRWQPTGKLIKEEDGSERFVDNPMLRVIFDEIQIMKNDEAVAEEESDDSGPESMIPNILFGTTLPPGVDVSNVWPEPSQAFSLWQTYLERVNPLTKIIHVPSLQPYIIHAAHRSRNLPDSITTLILSIFLMAVVSLTPHECLALLGQSRADVLQMYTAAVSSSLLRMNVAQTHSFTVLQALVLYLISLQGRYNRHAVWATNGMAIRIAQKLGLHRDPEPLGLSPFECEMRKRVWWQIIMLDAKYAMFSGLSHSFLPQCDTGPPKNLNDADLSPSDKKPYQDREGPTEMIFCLLTYRFARFLLDAPGFEGMAMVKHSVPDGNGPTEEQLAEYRRKVSVLRQDLLDILDKNSDPRAGPVHEMALALRALLIARLDELATPVELQADWGIEVHSAADTTFKAVISIFEHDAANSVAGKIPAFTWFSLLHFQSNIFLYLVGQLTRRTEGALVDRAWIQVEAVYSLHPELLDIKNKKSVTISSYVLRAWKKREEALLAQAKAQAEALAEAQTKAQAGSQQPSFVLQQPIVVIPARVEVPWYIEMLQHHRFDDPKVLGHTPGSLGTPPELFNGGVPYNGMMQMNMQMDMGAALPQFADLFQADMMIWDPELSVTPMMHPAHIPLPPPSEDYSSYRGPPMNFMG